MKFIQGPSFSYHQRNCISYFDIWWRTVAATGTARQKIQDTTFTTLTKGMFLHMKRFEIIQKSFLLANENICKDKLVLSWNMNVICRAIFYRDMWQGIASEMKVAVCYNLLTMLTLYALFALLLLLTLLRLPLLLYELWQKAGRTDGVE